MNLTHLITPCLHLNFFKNAQNWNQFKSYTSWSSCHFVCALKAWKHNFANKNIIWICLRYHVIVIRLQFPKQPTAKDMDPVMILVQRKFNFIVFIHKVLLTSIVWIVLYCFCRFFTLSSALHFLVNKALVVLTASEIVHRFCSFCASPIDFYAFCLVEREKNEHERW